MCKLIFRLVITLCCLMLSVPVFAGQRATITEGWYKIVPAHSQSKALDVGGAKTNPGANIQLWDYVGADQQKFYIKHIQNRWYSIKAGNCDLYVDAQGGVPRNGENVTQWANKGCLLIAEKGKELDTIKKLQIADAFNPTKQFRIRSMVDWSTFGDNSSPCTDIILVDQYVFSQSEYEYDVNSYALLEQLCKWAKGATVNIVIFTLKDYKDVNSYYPVPFVSITRNLKQKLGELIGVEPNITFVILPGQEQHDRTILTNYKMYTSGDSFKYFKDGENVSLCTHGEWMYISSLHDVDNFKNAKDFIHDLQGVIDKVKGGLMSIQGDKKSFYLRF